MSAPEASTHERASFRDDRALRGAPPDESPPEEENWDFPSKEAEDAYWAGVIDGTRNCGRGVEPRLAARSREKYPEIVLSEKKYAAALEAERRHEDVRAGIVAEGAAEFDPVPVRPRLDGWTPQKQRDYVEALADSGSPRHAAALVGMSEQSASRLRRRSDAASFDLACEAAMRHGARRLRAVAYERAILGTVRGRYYRGELVGEDRVYDNKLLVYLLGKAEKWLEPDHRAEAVADRWQPWMDALEEGAPPPPLPEPPAAPAAPAPVPADPAASARAALLKEAGFVLEEEEDDEAFDGDEVWQEDGVWWTLFAPPPGFTGSERGKWPSADYARTLSRREQSVYEARLAREAADRLERDAEFLAAEEAARDRFFGFSPDNEEEEDPLPAAFASGAEQEEDANLQGEDCPRLQGEAFAPTGAEPYEPFEPSTAAGRAPRRAALAASPP